MTRDERVALAIAVIVNVFGAMPLFLVGALSSLMAEDLHLSRAAIGTMAAAFPGTVTVASLLGGRFVQRAGYRPVVSAGAMLTVISIAGIAVAARSGVQVGAFLVLGGFAWGLTGPATDVAVSDGIAIEHQGRAFGFKQASMPGATLLAGLLVPLVAVSHGWRATFGVVAVVGGIVALGIARLHHRDRSVRPALPIERVGGEEPSRRAVWLVALGGCLGLVAASGTTIFLVDAGVTAGLSLRQAGLLLSTAGLAGIAGRLVSGVVVDRLRYDGLWLTSVFLLAGALGHATFAIGNGALYYLSAMLAFGFGSGWGGLIRYGLLRLYRQTSGWAIGVLNAGLAFGTLVGPLVFGRLVDATSYRVAWFAVTGVVLASAVCVALGRHDALRVASPSRTRAESGARPSTSTT